MPFTKVTSDDAAAKARYIVATVHVVHHPKSDPGASYAYRMTIISTHDALYDADHAARAANCGHKLQRAWVVDGHHKFRIVRRIGGRRAA